MSVRKREWIAPNGEKKTGWQVDYRDAAGKRRHKQFPTKRAADAFQTEASWEVSRGIHTADSQSITVEKAGENWIARCRREQLEPSTVKGYEEHLNLHIVPVIGAKRLNHLTTPMVEDFRDYLLDHGRSRAMAKRVLGSLTALIKEAKRTGYVAQNVASGVTVKRSGRDKAKVVPPTKVEMRLLIQAAGAADNARPMEKPMLLTLLFAGLRASELRGLPWRNVDLKGATIKVSQRADFHNTIGPPKSKSGFRTIPIPGILVAELKRWKLRCPASDLDLVFPSGAGTPIYHPNILLQFLNPLLKRAGMVGRFTLHDFRHACASLWIEQRVQPKRVQTWMGHHSIQVTFDTYGHLFDALSDEAEVMAAMVASVLADPEEEAAA